MLFIARTPLESLLFGNHALLLPALFILACRLRIRQQYEPVFFAPARTMLIGGRPKSAFHY